MAVYDHSGDIVFRILTQSFLCSANNDEEVPLQTHSQANGFHEFELFLCKAQYQETALLQSMQLKFRLPIAYHGKASSIVISGTDIIRPRID
ncbi:hypothetical protein YC2023_046287 [Brassica napus]